MSIDIEAAELARTDMQNKYPNDTEAVKNHPMEFVTRFHHYLKELTK